MKCHMSLLITYLLQFLKLIFALAKIFIQIPPKHIFRPNVGAEDSLYFLFLVQITLCTVVFW